MAIVYNLRSDQVPAVQAASAFTSAAAANQSAGGTAPGARNFQSGDSATVPGNLNENAQRLDLTARYGGTGGLYAICFGLAVTVSANVASVAPGHASVEGLIELPAAATNIALSPGSNYLWLNQAAQVVVTTTTAPPAGKAVYLGMATGGGATNDVDMSGVCVVRGPLVLRQTADAAGPLDTPPAIVTLITITQAGEYLWTGTSHVGIGGAGGGGGSGTVYFGALPHDSGDTTAHDAYAPAGGVHVTAADRSSIAANATAAASAATSAATANTNATSALAAASAAAAAAAAAVQTTDARLSDARTPLAHAATHGLGGSDPVALQSTQIQDIVTRVFSLMQASLRPGANVSIAVDAAAYTFTIATAAVTGGGFSGVGSAGSVFPVRANLKFFGNGVSVADNPGANETDITIPIGSAADLAAGSITVDKLVSGGTTPDLTKYYRGDGTWNLPAAAVTVNDGTTDYAGVTKIILPGASVSFNPTTGELTVNTVG